MTWFLVLHITQTSEIIIKFENHSRRKDYLSWLEISESAKARLASAIAAVELHNQMNTNTDSWNN